MPTLQVDDVAIHYAEAGSGPPLVFVHGLGGSWADWDYQITAFATRYRVLAPDLRGFGATPLGRRRPGVQQFVHDLQRFLDAAGIERCLLVGHSMGGAVCLQFALQFPQRVSRMVITNSVPGFLPRTRRQRFEVGYRLAVMALLGPARLARISALRMFPGEENAGLRAKVIERGSRNTRRAYLGSLLQLTRWSVIERLGEIRVPTLVVGGGKDYFGHDDVVRFAHALPRGYLHWFPQARHGLPSERPQEFNPVLQKFFDRRIKA
ncbi:MAG TPA: alpha/beta hydrolase [Solimonas sp.]|nr:alpha/beta hydrolase [Solimonas sp.]